MLLVLNNIFSRSQSASEDIQVEKFKQSPNPLSVHAFCNSLCVLSPLPPLSVAPVLLPLPSLLTVNISPLPLPSCLPAVCHLSCQTSSLCFDNESFSLCFSSLSTSISLVSFCPSVLGELYFLATGAPSATARAGVIYKIVDPSR